ncbi:helix-turn-helix domain-containing protein [Oceanobacter mangrovi]|uniref:helix-turn-helix domain-containing protein n=1 Tax=Oceanobacter mangrovi TaxID=2862510 RepID=UPI001C8EE99F|nr:helix-turn-helix domain-containing protein [Oceanobacter mangrovi]
MIPKLMSVSDWRTARFASNPPSEQTVKRWAKNGDIPAKKIGGRWFIMVTEELQTTGDELVDAVLRG